MRVAPGGTIGILGGGQLGRMLAMAAARLGYRTVGIAPRGDNVAALVSGDFTEARWDDRAAFDAFAARCDTITWEFENVPLDTIRALPADKLACPAEALATAQDRLLEKRFVEQTGGRAAPHRSLNDREELDAAIGAIGLPGILKTRRDGYDGKGQWRIASREDSKALDLPDKPLIYERHVAFAAEFSVILVRGPGGRVRIWDSPRNTHGDGILLRSDLPAGDPIDRQVAEARELSLKVADALGYVGVMTLEFFACAEGPVFNEIAPRVHNSGHWTIEGAVTSQFENHIRAICGLPLGDTSRVSERIAMHNLIGGEADDLATLLADPSAHVHLYGKGEARPGRKMGHVTKLARAPSA
jgi:5-(carboxyamino)imidazole ribonucleotide synthase